MSSPYLQSKEKSSSPSFIWVESSRVSTGNYRLYKVVPKPTPEELYKLTNEEWIKLDKAKKLRFWKNRENYIETW